MTDGNSSKGIFLVLDGVEGCGKSTQTKLLHGRLTALGRQVLLARDPGTTRIGEQVRGILLNPDHVEMGMRCEMLLYMAARAQLATELILPALEAGKVVICDRFVSSTLAYQLGGDGLSAIEIRAVAEVAIKGQWPDLTILLDLPVEQGLHRVRRAKDRIEQRPLAYHQQVRRNYLAQAQADPQRYRVVDATGSVEKVAEDVWHAAAPLVRP